MEHRHVTGDELGPTEIADIIGRGTLTDWVKFRDIVHEHPSFRDMALTICDHYIAMPEEDFPDNFRFWKSYLEGLTVSRDVGTTRSDMESVWNNNPLRTERT